MITAQQHRRKLEELPRLRERIAQFLPAHDLKACSLVCRAWYATAYPLLRPFVRAQAMDIPELATMVAQHLEASDLRSCALVRRTWYDNFNPFVWSTFVLNDVPAFEPSCYLLSSPMLSPSSPTLSIPPATMSHLECKAHPRCCKVNAVHKNADLIRHLIVRYVGPDCHPEEFYALFIEKCCSLQSLSFLVDGVYQEYTASLLRANPRICRQVSHFLLPEVTGPSSSAQGLQTRVLTIGGAR